MKCGRVDTKTHSISLKIKAIDCCYGIDEINCGLAPTAIGDDCLCKAGYEFKAEQCSKCQMSFCPGHPGAVKRPSRFPM